ncbi:MAG: M23 family metallopeptidase, partial [Oscillospiraceae bacterium]
WGGPYGNRVIIDHGNGMSTLYAHCLSGSLSVGVGQYVNAGDAIARVGSTGNSTGPHLHFEVRIGGKHVNPAPYLGLR